MTVVGDAVADYLTIRRALGFKLVEHQRLLRDFATFLEQTGASTITTELAVAWAGRCAGTEGWKAARLSVIRGFAAYMRSLDPQTEIPPTGILIARKHYAVPYLYSDQEIGRLLDESALRIPPGHQISSHLCPFALWTAFPSSLVARDWQGRDGARCWRYRRSVSPTRPPNRTCPFLSIRLSTGHALVACEAVSGTGWFPGRLVGRLGWGPRCRDVVPAVLVAGHRHLGRPVEPGALFARPFASPAPPFDLFPGQPRVLFA